ncbi:MAG TPA: adenylate/guanylate cyclase domain-containing protein [Anaerolineales bacterium]|nr:adenylate/guanylate cyclase domain-containing protein [Anaerolineales bacterium]
MRDLPSGTVTFLFTDIEGSTRLAQEYPSVMSDLLARHHEILNRAIAQHNGFVFQIVGDSFCASFHTAEDALHAALEAQRHLHNEAWSPGPLKVRMGVHTGTAQVERRPNEIQYSGYTTLALTQRIMSAGHGGQILISHSTRDSIQDGFLQQAQLLDMGERRLKDVLRTEHLYQVSAPDLPSEFPALKTLELFSHNLPAQLTSFIGREKEIAEIKKLIAENRMVTLSGSGGAGKTRLGLQVGAECLDQFSDGVWLVELAPVSDPALVSQVLLSIFNLREDSHRSALEVLTDYLRSRVMLLLLDNCEHLIEACAQISESLLHNCSKLKILASSREALGIAGEIPYRVPSLNIPNLSDLPSLDELEKADSIRLFVERAATARPDFSLTPDNASFVAQICFRLDGIPLAIELAASRAKVLTPEQIAARLDDRFRLLTGGSRTALPRQQTLRAMIDWSYSLLSEEEKTLFRRLAVFFSGWTLEAAESVCGGEAGESSILELLTRLVDKSLVYIEESAGGMRYHRLETIRQYSREKFFEMDEVETIRDRHLNYYVQFAELVEENLKGGDQVIWQRRMSLEQDNLRAALEWGVDRNPENALRIVGAANLFWTAGGYSAEGFRWTQKALEQVAREHNPEDTASEQRRTARAKALCGLTRLYLSLGDNANAKRAAEESVTLYRQSQDPRGLSFALVVLAYPLDFLGERERAEKILQESYSIARAEGDVYIQCRSLNILARVVIALHHDLTRAGRYVEESLRLAREAGLRSQEAQACEILATIAMHKNNIHEAQARFQESAEIYEKAGARFNVILEKSNLAHLERRLGNFAGALEYYRETIIAFRDIAQIGAVSHQLECFGFIALEEDRYERALELFAAAHVLREKRSTPMTPDEELYFEEQLTILREKMDEMEFDQAWSKGHMLTMEEAIDFALEDPDA